MRYCCKKQLPTINPEPPLLLKFKLEGGAVIMYRPFSWMGFHFLSALVETHEQRDARCLAVVQRHCGKAQVITQRSKKWDESGAAALKHKLTENKLTTSNNDIGGHTHLKHMMSYLKSSAPSENAFCTCRKDTDFHMAGGSFLRHKSFEWSFPRSPLPSNDPASSNSFLFFTWATTDDGAGVFFCMWYSFFIGVWAIVTCFVA